MIGRQKQRKFQRVPKRIYKEKSKINTSIKGESHRIPFVTTFNPTLPNIPQVISRNLNILRFSQRCLEAFSSPPRISYRCCKNLRDILVRAKHRSQASTPPPPPRLRELQSIVTEIGARRAPSLQREPHLTLFSLPTNKDAYAITSPALLTNRTETLVTLPGLFQITLPFFPTLWTTQNSFLSNSPPQMTQIEMLFARKEKHF